MKRFYSPETADKRIFYAKAFLEKRGFEATNNEKFADFILLGVNPKKEFLNFNKTIFAGNVHQKNNIFDYTKNEIFAIKNAYLTAEAALSLAIEKSEKSLINSYVLIVGNGRIAKALTRYIKPFSRDLTVCLRNENEAAFLNSEGIKTIRFSELESCEKYSFIFNTVPHPVFNEKELESINKNALLIDLASFPGGVDKHFAKHLNINLITAGGLPGKYSPETAGEIVAKTVLSIIEEEGL